MYRHFLFVPALLAVLFATGCGTDRTVGPDTQSPTPETTDTSWHNQYSDEFGPSGGFLGGSSASLTIAEDALTQSTEMTLEVCPGAEPLVYLGPTNQELAVASTLSIAKPPSYDPEATYHIFVLNPSTQQWEDEGGTDQGAAVTLAVTQCRTYKLSDVIG